MMKESDKLKKFDEWYLTSIIIFLTIKSIWQEVNLSCLPSHDYVYSGEPQQC